MTVRRAARARARALLVPVLMSPPMWLVIGELALGWYGPVRQLGRYGPAALTLVVVLVLAAAADTGAGERWLARVFLRARAPRLHQRHTLAPVAQVLLRHGIPPQRLELLVGPGQQVVVTALGRRTVVVSRGLVDALWSGQLGPEQAAAVITHEVGVMRSGLTRHDPAVMVLLAPWTVWITWIAVMWGVVATFLSHRVMVACLVIHAGVGIWLGATEDPAMYVSTVVMAVVLATWWSNRSWDRARAQVGDQYLLQVVVDSCNRKPEVTAEETPEEVRLHARVDRSLAVATNDCADGATVMLEEPLGSRPVVDESTGAQLTVQKTG